MNIGVSIERHAYACTRCARVVRAYIPRFLPDCDLRLCATCHRATDPGWAVIADALEVIVTAAGGRDGYDEVVYETISHALSLFRLGASDLWHQRLSAIIAGNPDYPPTITPVVDSELCDGVRIQAYLRDGRPWISIGDGGYPLWEDDAQAARELVGQISDVATLVEMAAAELGPEGKR